jgi:hypothetical protein
MRLGFHDSGSRNGLPSPSTESASGENAERSLRDSFQRTRPVIPPTDLGALRIRLANAETPESGRRSRKFAIQGTVAIRIAAGLVAVAVLGLWATAIPRPVAAMPVFEESEVALARAKSVRFEMSAFENGVRRNNSAVDVRILAPGHLRIDEPGGNYMVIDIQRGKSLRVAPHAKRFQLIMRAAAPNDASSLDIYNVYRKVDRKRIRDLPSRTIGGVQAVGFESVLGDPFKKGPGGPQYLRAWVHPETKLLLRLEHQPSGAGSYGFGSMPVAVCENFAFDEPMDPGLFSLDPPNGYEATP